MTKRTPAQPTATPQAKLSAVIKSARDAMRKDAGLNGDLDRIPQLAWLLFLKAFDGLEASREVTERQYRPAIGVPYRWRDWAAERDGRTGNELLAFVNDELLPHLRELKGTGGAEDSRDVIAAVFKETFNRMLSGYLLRDVVNKIDQVNFTSADDIHTMAHLYESMLREMRDAAGDSGEFYTPRPLIRFIVQQVDPRLGEVVLDPARGTGGFLVETIEHLRPRVHRAEDLRSLDANIRGIEKKPLPYLLGMMNLLLHGVQQPHIVRDNALRNPITEIRKVDKVDVILTNPPFGGEEEAAIAKNFPESTAETAWLFLQLVIRRLKDGGRCGIVVPNGVLFADGLGARIKENLLTECNLHTIVRLPEGVFSPYTAIPTNLLFFEKTGRTRETWYYEIRPPEGRRNYTKTKPIRFEEFATCREWWGGQARVGRKATETCWRVSIAEIEADSWNLDRTNPQRSNNLAETEPDVLIAELVKAEREILDILLGIRAEIGAAW